MADCELEDGELCDSDKDDPIRSGMQAEAPQSSFSILPVQRRPNPRIYRDMAHTVMSSSNSDDDSDEEKFLWKRKRLKYAATQGGNKVSDSKFGGADHGTTFGSWPPTNQNPRDIVRAKKQNVWSAVLQEQILSQGFVGFDMEHKSKAYNDRSVEAYSFKRAEEDHRPWFNHEDAPKETNIKNGDIFGDPADLDDLEENFGGARKQSLKRKLPVKERLGPRQHDKRKARHHYMVTESDPVDVVAEAVADKLQEPKVDLILKVVRTMGRKKTLELAYITEDIEESGGMLINNGSRRRTPGGIFFQMLKSDSSFSKDKMKAIFGEEMKKDAKRKKKLRSKQMKLNMQKKKLVSVQGEEETMEMGAGSNDEATDKTNSVNDEFENDENSKDTSSHGSSDASSCPDPATMDLSELLKQHVERRHVEEEEKKKKAMASEEEMNEAEQPVEIQSDLQPEKIISEEVDLYLDDESEMTFDL